MVFIDELSDLVPQFVPSFHGRFSLFTDPREVRVVKPLEMINTLPSDLLLNSDEKRLTYVEKVLSQYSSVRFISLHVAARLSLLLRLLLSLLLSYLVDY